MKLSILHKKNNLNENQVYMIYNFALTLLLFLNISCSKSSTIPVQQTEGVHPDMDISILTSANSWVYDDADETNSIITDTGIDNWTHSETKIRTYFWVKRIGEINIGLRAKVHSGSSIVKLTFNGVSKEINIDKADFEDIFAETFTIDHIGYFYVELQGVSKTGLEFAKVPQILLGGEASKGDMFYIKDDVYFGRRGPSVHLNYEIPESASDVVWFYNEVSVPEGNDVVGSYFMANGFGEGYFGMQVNSSSERRFLFSVWSPFETDNPDDIPENQRIILLRKGNNVITGSFGNEGSGGQSYRKFLWKAGSTYKFLLKAEPSINNSTDYTAFIFASEIGKWELMASFRRPQTTTYITRPHSFLENFITSEGNKSRMAIYSNQWVYDTNGVWHELTKAKFTADATARKKARLDYAGGIRSEGFFLENCGFFSKNMVINSCHTRASNRLPPSINFNSLTNE